MIKTKKVNFKACKFLRGNNFRTIYEVEAKNLKKYDVMDIINSIDMGNYGGHVQYVDDNKAIVHVYID